jgi:hypothetical protein
MEMKIPPRYTMKTGIVLCKLRLFGGFILSSVTANGKYFPTIAFRIPFLLIC